MPWRFLGFIIVSVFFLIFIGFNLDNRCDVSFGFVLLPQVPVYLTAFASFVLGMLWALPMIIFFKVRKTKARDKNRPAGGVRKRGKKGEPQEIKESLEESPYANDGSYGID